MRLLLAFIFAFPIYMTIDFGWILIPLIALQVLAGIDAELPGGKL